MKKISPNLPKTTAVLALLVFAASFSNAATTIAHWDFKAGGFVVGTNNVTRWVSQQGVVLEFSDWALGSEALQSTGGSEGGGLKPEHETASNKTVRAGVFLVKPDAPMRVRTALFTGQFTARTANFPNGGLEGAWDVLGPAAGVRVWVNGSEGAPLQKSDTFQIVSFLAPAEMKLEKAMVLGDPFSAWNRKFLGEVKVVVLISGDVSEAALRGMENAIALRHGVAGIRSATPLERQAAQATGFNAFGVWGTWLLVR